MSRRSCPVPTTGHDTHRGRKEREKKEEGGEKRKGGKKKMNDK